MATDEEIRAVLVAAGVDPDEKPTVEPVAFSDPPTPTEPVDYRTASKEEFQAELRRLGVNPRHK